MTAVILPIRPHRPAALAPRLVLRCDRIGCWTVSAGRRAIGRFPNLATALDCASRGGAAGTGVIEVWQGRNYICSLTRDGGGGEIAYRARPACAAERPLAAAAERYANRAAQIVMEVGGPLFWLALILLGVAGHFGWKLPDLVGAGP